MIIDNIVLENLEKLSMLKIDNDKKEELAKQLTEILTFVDNLNELDIKVYAKDSNGVSVSYYIKGASFPQVYFAINPQNTEGTYTPGQRYFIDTKITTGDSSNHVYAGFKISYSNKEQYFGVINRDYSKFYVDIPFSYSENTLPVTLYVEKNGEYNEYSTTFYLRISSGRLLEIKNIGESTSDVRLSADDDKLIVSFDILSHELSGNVLVKTKLNGQIESNTKQVYLTPNQNTHVELEFDGRDIYNNGIDGPYTIENIEITSNGETRGFNIGYTTQGYSHSDFESKDAEFDGIEQTLPDENSNNYYDGIKDLVDLSFIEGGDYTITGKLYGSSGELITSLTKDISADDYTMREIEFYYDGGLISESEVDPAKTVYTLIKNNEEMDTTYNEFKVKTAKKYNP